MKILTFDIEEWFHILDNDSTRSEYDWRRYPCRIYENMERIFSFLAESNQSASFFIVGWIAENYPDIVKQIVNMGHEVGSHTHLHQLVYDQTPNEFKNDIEYSIKTIEDISGKKVRLFRAPGFSITEKNKWAFEVMHEVGIEIDSSIFPASHAHGGFFLYKDSQPSILSYNGINLKEFPINTTRLLWKNMVFSGGGYFRLFPYFFIKKWTKNSDYVMSYFHPRDFDYEQPVIEGLGAFREFKSYIGLKSTEKKFKKWIKDFEFVDILQADKLTDWNNAPVVNL